MSLNTGVELKTFTTSLNTDLAIDETLLDTLIDNAKSIIEEERPWVVLRKTDTSLSLTASNTWETKINLSTITDFSRFYGEVSIKLFDGTNQIQRYRLVPFDRRLEYKDASNTACYDENAKILYFNGVIPFAGTLYINYIASSTAIDLSSDDTVWSVFPPRFLPLLGYYAIGINKGAIDYDSINRQMLSGHREMVTVLKRAMEKWDTEKQLNSLVNNDPTDLYGGFRSGAINTND